MISRRGYISKNFFTILRDDKRRVLNLSKLELRQLGFTFNYHKVKYVAVPSTDHFFPLSVSLLRQNIVYYKSV